MGTREEGIRRKNEILDAALLLFERIGYSQTTVQAILDEVGIGKGTFYHHFRSKDEVLDEIVERSIDAVYRILEAAAGDAGLSALEKLRKVTESVQEYRNRSAGSRRSLIRIIMREENHTLAYKYTERVLEKTRGLYASILSQGVEEGVFDIRFPEKTAELIIRTGNRLRAELVTIQERDPEGPEKSRRITEIIEFMQDSTARLLGISPQRLNIAETLSQANPEGGW